MNNIAQNISLVLLFAASSQAAVITVNSTNDPAGFNTNLTVGTLGPTVTLRDAVTAANNTPGDDTITFDASLGGKTIPLSQAGLFIPHVTGVVTNDDSTALFLTSNVAITGPSGGITLLRDTGGQRLLCVAQGATVSVSGIKFQAGSASSGGGAIWNEGDLTVDGVTFQSCGSVPRGPPYYDLSGFGGGIHNVGSLKFRNSSMIFNYAGAVGGGIYNAPGAWLEVTNAYFDGCYAEAGGGAIANLSTNGSIRVTRSTFKGNSQQYAFGNAGAPFGGGGAIGNSGNILIDQCTFTNNWTRESNGGAVFNKGSAGVSASTFVGNHVRTNYMFGSGGAVASEGPAGLTNCTFTANHAPNGGSAVYGYPAPLSMIHCTVVGNVVTNTTLTYNHAVELASGSQVYNSIIAANDVWNTNTASWHTDNLVAPSSTLSNNLVSTNNTYVGALSNNGGPVQTMPLFSGSAAVNYGTAAAGVTNDARGAARYEQPDAGAYELPTYAPIPLAPTSTVFVIGADNAFQFMVDSGLPTTFYLLAALPSGLTLSTNGLLAGVPSAPSGIYPLSIRVVNDYHYTDFAFQLIISDGTQSDRFSWQLNGGTALTNGVFTLTAGGGGEARSAWYLFKQDINAFQASFDYLAVSNNGIADGMAFVLQNDPAGINALGGAGGGLGYEGITPSFALNLNLYAGAPGGSGIQIATGGQGLGTNTYINSAPAVPASGDPIKVDLYYLNGLLDVTMTNLASGLAYATNFSIDIPVAASGNQAWVGMTAATGGETAYQYVSNFVFTSLSAVSTVIVNNATDPGGFDTNIIIGALGTNVTLRDAVNAANNHPAPVVIRFDPALGTTNISLLQTGDASAGNSALAVRGTIIIENTTGTNILIRRGSGGMRLFRVLNGGNLTLRNLRLTEGNIGYDTNGGGILLNDAAGSLTVEECFFSGGYGFYGGAIHNNGTSVVLRTTIQSCGARSGGGGIYNGGLLSVGESTIVSNTSEAYTGYWPGGGAIYCGGTTYVTNSTLAYNSAAGYYGGALSISGPTEVHHCTIAFNTALYGAPDIIGSMLAKNTIVTDGSYLGLHTNSTHNLIYNPGLGTFGDHGGPTYTFPITTNSAAFKGGAMATGVTTDQRGEPRHTIPDVGAYEIYPRDPFIVSTTLDEDDGTADVEQGTGTSLREALAYASMQTGTQTITFASALAGQSVLLTNGWTGAGDASALRVTNAVVIQGLSSAPGVTLAVDAAAQKRHFLVESGGHLTLQDLTLTGGYGDNGGSVWNLLGSLVVRRCTFFGNEATAEGGAIQVWGGSPLFVIENSTLVSNTAAGVGSAMSLGAVSNVLSHITVTGNTGPQGSFRLYNCIVPIHNSIVAGNNPDNIEVQLSGAFDPASSGNLLGAGNTAGISNGVNGNLTGLTAPDLFLGGLSATNGGPTPTCALLPNTPAVNRGVNLGLATDQRGTARVKSGLPDAGAFEMDLVESQTVNITNDEFNATSDPRFGAGTSLREALTFNSGAVMDASMEGKTIVLSTVGDTNRGNSAIAVLSGSKFVASARPGITITGDGPETMRLFRIAPGSEFGMYGLTLTGGNAPDGGAILNEGYLFVNYTTLAGNTATNAGGAVFTEVNALSQFVNATLAGNTAGLWGGALANKGTNELSYITVSDNQGAIGGGGIFNYTGSRTKLLDTIVAGNRRPDNNPTQIAGPQPVTSDSAYNLIGIGEAVGLTNGVNNNLVGVADPKLGPLTNNGGRTPTMALLPGSPAIDAGLFLGNQAAADQRSASRSGVPVDIGAYELQISSTPAEIVDASMTMTTQQTFGISFSGNALASFSAYATTNVMLPITAWEWLGSVPQDPPGSGQFNFTMPVDTNQTWYFIGVQSP